MQVVKLAWCVRKKTPVFSIFLALIITGFLQFSRSGVVNIIGLITAVPITTFLASSKI